MVEEREILHYPAPAPASGTGSGAPATPLGGTRISTGIGTAVGPVTLPFREPAPAPVRPPDPVILPPIALDRPRDRELIYAAPAPVYTAVVALNSADLAGADLQLAIDDPNATPLPLQELQVLPVPAGVRRIYLSHPAMTGKVLRLALFPTGMVPVLARPGTVTVQLPGQDNVASESTLLEVRDALARLPVRATASRRVQVDLTVDHSDWSLVTAGGLVAPVQGVALTVLRLGSAPWSIRFQPAAAHPDVWYSTDFNEGTMFEGDFTDVWLSNVATAGATPAVISLALRQ